MAFSDEEVFGSPPDVMSDADIWGTPKKPVEVDPSYTGTIGRVGKRYADDAGAAVSEPFKMDKGPGSETLQRIGDFGGRVGSIAADTVGTVLSPIEAGFSSGLGLIAQEQAEKHLGRKLTPEEAAKIQQITDDTGQLLTMAVMAPSVGEKAGPVRPDPTKPFDKAVLDVPPTMKKLMAENAGTGDPAAIADLKKFMKSEASGGPDVLPTPKNVVRPFESTQVHNSISDMYGKVLEESKQNYKNVSAIGEGLQAPVKGLREQLDKVIADINKDPLHEGRSALSDLERIREKIVGGEKSRAILDAEGRPMQRQLPDLVSANDLIDIKQYLNEGFNPKRFAERSDNPYYALQKTVKKSLSDVSDMHPPFGEALDTADKFWVNNVDLPYRSNSVLHRFWTPEDYNAVRSMKRGMAEKLPDATRERQYKMLTKVRNPVEFESLYNSLPPSGQEAFSQALRDHIKEDLGLGWGTRFKNIVSGGFDVLPKPLVGWHPQSGINKILKGFDPQVPPETADILKAIKGEKYQRGGAIKNVNTDPTPAQKMAGNYKKAHVKFHGLDISIENPKGTTRKGKGKDGKEWKSVMPYHYGYIKRTQGADDDHVDVCIGPNDKSNRVYVIDQKDADTGKFDEHKCMLGYGSRDDAQRDYRAAFSDEKDRIMKITRLSIDEFKEWLKNGDTRKPLQKVA